LFPELLHNDRRGHSAAAVKWFSGYLKRLGWPRTGKKVFHSFRHTLASECLNSLGLSEQVTAQISGHARGTSVLTERYRKDVEIDELARDVARLDFGLKEVARFDVEEGVKALKDALRRKRKKVLPAH
jgi:integrase